MGELLFKDSGYFTTIQDLGRWGGQSQGFCVSGAMDHFALKVANLLVGNSLGEACLEMIFKGAEIQFKGANIISITGAEMLPEINHTPIKQWKIIKINSGDILTLNSAKSGFRSYLSIKGGLNIALFLGSKSTTPREEIGGFKGRAIRKGDVIEFNSNNDFNREREIKYYRLKNRYIPKYDSKIKKIRVIDGPYSENFTEKGIKTFYDSLFLVYTDIDRTAYRLEGPFIEHKVDAGKLISGAMIAGAIEVPGSGKPIILTAERRTHGGYSVIATVATVDLPIIAQSRPGDKFKFELIDLTEAQDLLKQENNFFKKFYTFIEDINISLFNIPNYYESSMVREMEV